MKELLDLFEDEYFIQGRNISVDRLRKRLELLDSENTNNIGFNNEIIKELNTQICNVLLLILFYCSTSNSQFRILCSAESLLEGTL